MADTYKVNNYFNLIKFAHSLTEYFNTKNIYSADIRQEGQFLCSINIRKGTHQGIIRLSLIGCSLWVSVSETLDSKIKNIGMVVLTATVGFVVGKGKIVGKSAFGTAGVKTLENMDFTHKIKRHINKYIKILNN